MVDTLKSLFRRVRIWTIRTLCGKRSLDLTSLGALCILVPHPDDEVFGCGQLISILTSQGKNVFIVFFSCGGASHIGCCDLKPEGVEKARCQKAKEILTDLGVQEKNIFFMNMPDGELAGSIPSAYQKIKQLVTSFTGATLLAPHPQEGWSDHEAVAKLAEQLAVETKKELFYYCIWFYFSMPFRKFHHVEWRKAYSLHQPDAWQKKTAACRKYLAHCAPCGKPYTGVLPDELIEAISYRNELFFKSN